MSRFHSYLSSAEKIIRQYMGDIPLHLYLKQFFALNKQMGGRDRRIISQLCYQYFRLGKYDMTMPVFERVVLAARISPHKNEDFLRAVDPEWAEEKNVNETVEEIIPSIFPFANLFSAGINAADFGKSMLVQPSLFLRIRPGREAQIMKAIAAHEIEVEKLNAHCLELSNATNVADTLHPNEWVVVQDKSSQQTGDVILANVKPKNSPVNIWDCCAASGGKSIMLFDLFENIQLTVSDIRDSILHNLAQRFKEAGMVKYDSFIADLTRPQKHIINEPFDIVVADVPCSGSGTWARTPEQLYYFDEKELKTYADRQFKIASNTVRWIKPGGYLVYITCSVFAAENEGIVEQLLKEANEIKLVTQQVIAGYHHNADSMFIAILQKA